MSNEWEIDNLPNRLTMFRVILIPIIVFSMFSVLVNYQWARQHTKLLNYVAAWTFVAASITDFLDGFIARRKNIVTVFGSFLDPIADKFLVISALIMLLAMNRVNVLVVLILVLREMYITALRLLAIEKGLSVPVGALGKWKTATQMDIKVDGLSFEILEKALMQAHEGRMHILGKILETMPEPRADLKEHAPRIVTMMIPKELIGAVIGPGGKIIQGIQAESGATVSIEEVDGGGRIEIAGTNKAAIDCAMDKIKGIVSLPEIGEVYPSKVKSIMAYGAFVEFMPGKEGLLHISEIDWQRFDTMEQTGLKEGDKIDVKLLEVDQKTGKFKLSAKVLKEKPEGYVEPERRPRPERGERDERRPRPDRGERPERKDFRDPENRNDLV
jgi:CDP-diacylglycerol--glycerol-3-phosphate 3-phosphatidyltransferase